MPSNILYKETLSEKRQVPVKKLTGRRTRGHFAMLPLDVMRRKDITAADKLVLEAMNNKSRGSGVCGASQGVLSEMTGLSRAKVIDSQRALESIGLISKYGIPNKQIQAYCLLHNDMRANCEPDSVRVEDRRKKPVLVPCSRCRELCGQHRTGWCPRCRQEARNQVITKTMIQQELDRRMVDTA